MKVLQVFSKQAIMIEALMNSLTRLLERNGGGIIPNLRHINCQKVEGERDEWLDFSEAVPGNSNTDDNAHIVNISVNGRNIHSLNLEVIGSRCTSSSSSSHTNERTGGNSGTSRSSADVCSIPSPFISSMNKLCLATLDSDGHCLEAHGSLRVLLEVM
ncbi:unnamed protein product [Litomosoides sigmodontis]|uniref:Uncharacterized protein n=1 Tax=Litomosoides sigmodontis TaxID=42156 RepID=A0A3P6RY06_LITSI|nr:unnamed protein product [Litomosoides sigmodontis]